MGIGPRELALQILQAVERGGAYAGLALDHALERHRLSAADRRLVTELVYGTTRTRNTLDWALGAHLRRPLETLPGPIRNVLRLGAYQLLYLDRIPAPAACDEAVKLARRYGHRGTAGLVNAVLRRLAEQGMPPLPDPDAEPAAYLSLAHHHPLWLVERWLVRLGRSETEALCRAGNIIPPTTVRVNVLRTDPRRLREELGAAGVTARPGELAPEALLLDEHPPLRALASFRRGLFTVQDESSMLAAHTLAPRPGDRVVDACSAPGGKATHLAELMGDRGEVVAVDVSPGRLRLVEETSRRLGHRCIRTLAADARDLGRILSAWADAVLVDAPCSGLGTIRRRPDLRWSKRPEDLAVLSALQRAILAGAAGCLKPGGVLVYSTCSTEPEENAAVVEAFVEANPDFEPEDPTAGWPRPARDRVAARRQAAGSRQDGPVQLWPHLDGTDGFFIARLRRKDT